MIETPQKEWNRKTLEYVGSINRFVEKGLRDGWDAVGKEPEDPGRTHLIEDALSAVRLANSEGRLKELREYWPPAHEPFIDILDANGQSIPLVHILPDKSIVAWIGAPYEGGRAFQIQGESISELPDTPFFGVCPNRRYFGYSLPAGVKVTDGWHGPQTVMCPWPTGKENIPLGFDVKEFSTHPIVSRLIPFPDGNRVLLISEDGIFVISSEKSTRLLPTEANLAEHFAWLNNEYPGDNLSMPLSMEHGAVSKNGKLIAVGSQDSSHLVFDENLSLVGDVGNFSEYPHYALFSSDNDLLAFNSCHSAQLFLFPRISFPD